MVTSKQEGAKDGDGGAVQWPEAERVQDLEFMLRIHALTGGIA